jgi:hypothetical protein
LSSFFGKKIWFQICGEAFDTERRDHGVRMARISKGQGETAGARMEDGVWRMARGEAVGQALAFAADSR